jgi:hypothetical protein
MASKSYHKKLKNTFFFCFIKYLGKVFDKEAQKRQENSMDSLFAVS